MFFLRFPFALMLFLVCILTSCELFTKYKKPDVDIPRHWNRTDIQQKKMRRLASLKWWHQFHSTELNSYIARALHKNHNILLAINNIELAQAELKTIKLSWIPGLPIVGGFTQLPLFGNPGTLLIAAPDYILNILRLYEQQKTVEKKIEANRYLKNATQLMIIHLVSSAYLSLLSEREALMISQQLLKDYEAKLHLRQSNFHAGLNSIDNVLETESKIYLIKAKIRKIKHNIHASENVLHYLMNQNPGALNTKKHFAHIPTAIRIPLDYPINIIDNRPDIQKVQFELESRYHHVDATIARLFPSINLGGFFGYGRYIQGSINAPNASAILNTLDPPTYGKIDFSRAQFRRKVILYVHTIRKALKDIDTDINAYQANLAQYHQVDMAYKTIQQRCTRAKIRRKYGISSALDVIDCRIQAHEMALIRNQKKLTQVLTISRLFEDLGVGYAP